MDAFKDYLKYGWALTPIKHRTKQPFLKDWTNLENAIRGTENADKLHGSAGLLLAYCNPPRMTLDVDDFPDANAWLDERGIDLARLLQADDAVQITSNRPNRAKLVYHMDNLRLTQKVIQAGKTILEFRCADRNGGSVQDVLPPSIHPDTGEPYEWKGDWRHVPKAPIQLLSVWDELLKFEHPTQNLQTTVTSLAKIESALSVLDPDSPYDSWIRVGEGIHETTNGSKDGLSLWNNWSRDGEKYKVGECEYKWQSFSVEGGVTIATVFHMAKKNGWQCPNTARSTNRAPKPLLGVTTATEVTMKKIDWIWEGMLAKGKVHMLSGNGGRGKTTLMLAIAALITRGGKFPNATTSTQPAPVIYISGEDSINDTLLPRFVAGDGDRRLFHVTERPLSKSGEYLAIHEHAAELELLVNRYQPALLIIDPVTAFCGRGTDNNNATDIRIIMARLQELASSTGTAIMALNHMTKPRGDGRDTSMVGRVLGSGAWVHASRLVWGVIEEESGGRLVGLLKSNLGPLEHVYPYTLCQTLVDEIPAQRATIGARANGECLSNYVDFEVTSHGAKTTNAEVKIRELLADGPRSKQEIIAECVGIGERTLERVAKELGVHSTREGVHGKSMWELT
jgi:hypothetical protein